MRDFDGPEEFLESLRDADIIGKPVLAALRAVQALKFLQTQGHAAGRARGHAPAQGAPSAVAGRDAQ